MAGTKLAVDCCHLAFGIFGACRHWLQVRGGVPLLLPSALRSRKSCARLSLDTSRRLAPLAVSGSRSHCSADVPSAAVAASLMHCSRSALRAGCSSGMLLTGSGAFVLAPAFAWEVRRRCEATAASSSAVAGSICWISEIRCTILPMSRCASPSCGYLEDMGGGLAVWDHGKPYANNTYVAGANIAVGIRCLRGTTSCQSRGCEAVCGEWAAVLLRLEYSSFITGSVRKRACYGRYGWLYSAAG